MGIRRWLALSLCLGALAWSCTGLAHAGGGPTGAGKDPAAQAVPAEMEGTDGFQIVDEVPKILNKVPPRYPDGARKRGEQGIVYVRALVKKDGTTTRVEVPAGKGATPELDKAAVEAVCKWTFVPAKTKGKPVAVYVFIPVNFKLK